MPDWRQPNDYAFTAALDGAQWAWQFLRRNPHYQRDWQWFTETWTALERDYGSPPARDYQRWKQDPRAWRPAREAHACDTGECAGGEQLLIECWMGLRWGFHKFPLDPACERPQIPEQLCWRIREPSTRLVDAHWQPPQGDPLHLALEFDLGSPLKSQLEEARRLLLISQRRLRQQGALHERTIDGQAARWTLCLRALDGAGAGVSAEQLAETLGLPSAHGVAQLLADARALCAHGYLDLLYAFQH